MGPVIASGSFDDLRLRDVRFLQEAARLGPVHVLLWEDDAVLRITGQAPKFSLAERRYLLEALRYVDGVTPVEALVGPDALPAPVAGQFTGWAVPQDESNEAKEAFCRAAGLAYHGIPNSALGGLLSDGQSPPDTGQGRKKVLVTGCFDWLHSGHVRFFEEASQLGDLYVVVGHDENVRMLKGAGHPLFGQEQRRYMVQSVRYVTAALISTGTGWMDAGPEIERIRPEIYAVNEDGDRPEKRAFCDQHGLEYVVMRRLPKAGLPARESTHLRGF